MLEPSMQAMLWDCQVRLPAQTNAAQVYQAIGAQLRVLERLVTSTTLQCLHLDLQVTRLGLYEQAGLHLSGLAALIRDDVEDEEAPTPLEHGTYQTMSEAMVRPMETQWPRVYA